MARWRFGNRDKRSKGKSKGRSKSRSKKHVTFYFCKKHDHYINEYPLRKGKKFDKHESSTDSDSKLVSKSCESSEVLSLSSKT